MDILAIIKKPAVIAAIAVAALVIAAIFYFGGEEAPTYDFVTLAKMDLTQIVSVTGKVKPAKDVDLAFEKAGKISVVLVDVGDRVSAGQVMVRQDSSELSAQLLKARATLEAEEAELAELKTGVKPEELKVQEVKVANAKLDLVDKIKDAYTKSDDAVRNKVDQFISNPKTDNPQVNFSVGDSQLETYLESQRVTIEIVLNAWKMLSDVLTTKSDLPVSLETTKANLVQISQFLDKAAQAVNGATAGASYRADVATARTNVNTVTINLTTAESILTVAENELVVKKSGSSPEAIATQEANIKQAEADVLDYEAKLAKTVLYSPIHGIVTTQDAKVGQVVSANQTIVSIMSEAQFQLEAFIPETDIAKVQVGNLAILTFDAYGPDEVFSAKVAKIEPGETIIEGVTTYKTILQFDEKDDRIRSSMSADVDIQTAKRESVLAIPQRAILTKSGDKIARVIRDGRIDEVKVETGLAGQDGLIEITQGLNEGDKVIIYEY